MHRQGHRTETDIGDPRPMEIRDQLGMLVTSDPVAELDHALTFATARLRDARARDDTGAARRMLAWIDHLLDERLAFQHKPGPASSPRCGMPEGSSGSMGRGERKWPDV